MTILNSRKNCHTKSLGIKFDAFEDEMVNLFFFQKEVIRSKNIEIGTTSRPILTIIANFEASKLIFLF